MESPATDNTDIQKSDSVPKQPRKSILKNSGIKYSDVNNVKITENNENNLKTTENFVKINENNVRSTNNNDNNNENNAKNNAKYPDSVIVVSQLINEASKDSGGKTSSSSSNYSSPIGSPTPVTCSQHHCGSLFARCAQFGRCQLLQTFTDTSSQLSRQTFLRHAPPFYRYPAQRSTSLNCIVPKQTYIPKNHSENGLVNITTSLSELQPQRDSSILLQTAEPPSDGEQSTGSEVKSILVRRHSSLPNSEQSALTLSEIIVEKARGRSNSEGRLKGLPKRPGTPVQELQELDGGQDDDGRYYVSDSSDEFLEEVTDTYEDYAADPQQIEHYSMGNGVINCNGDTSKVIEVTRTSSTTYCHSNNKNDDLEYFRALVPRIKQEAKDWEAKADVLENQVLALKRELKKRDQEKGNLQRELHKLKSVLQQTTSLVPEGDLLTCLQDSHGMPGQFKPIIAAPNSNKKQGVSGESSADHGKNLEQIQIQRYDKDFRSKQLIKDAIMENDFLKNLDSGQLREIVESMFPRDFPRGSYVIKEGDAGSHLYVSAEGELEVVKDAKVLGRMGPRKAFGELAILYNCRRTASIRVVSDAKVWVLDRRVFQKIMMRTGLQRLQDNVNFLRSVPLLHQLSYDVLSKIADVLEVEFYPSDAHIIRQGANGDTFFIIRQGSVKVTQRVPGRREEEEIRVLTKGDYFGEQALLKEDIRTANVIALSPGVECLTLDRDSFIQLIGDLSELHEKDYGDESRGMIRPSSAVSLFETEEYNYIRLDDLDVVATLGVGGFGRVELVQYIYDRSLTFALKCLKKQHIVDTQQQEHVYSEKNIMKACNSPFISRLYRTFRDSKYVYMLLEACLGGEVWTILRDRGCFDDNTTKFVTSCVLEAFEYLHARGIIYRDLKPENLLLDNHGYVKLVDFGFSKRLGFSAKTWTFCGTPEYVAPEIILNKGHDRAVDYWSLGVLMHELLTGTPPFTASDPMKTYNIILKGIDMVDFPKNITRAAQSLIKRLCRDSPSERLGYQRGGIDDIRKHKWFQGFHWDGLRQRALVAPIIPQVRGPVDTTNFDCYPKDHDLPADEFSNWDNDF